MRTRHLRAFKTLNVTIVNAQFNVNLIYVDEQGLFSTVISFKVKISQFLKVFTYSFFLFLIFNLPRSQSLRSYAEEDYCDCDLCFESYSSVWLTGYSYPHQFLEMTPWSVSI